MNRYGPQITFAPGTRYCESRWRNILFATDFSEASEAALVYAAAISRHYDSQLHVVHIMSPASYIVPSHKANDW